MHIHLAYAPPRIPRAAMLTHVDRPHVTRSAPIPRALVAGSVPPERLPDLMRELNAFDSGAIGAAIDAMIACLDQRDGDVDVELNGDELDAAWIEGRSPALHVSGNEDDEEDDPTEADGDEFDCGSGEDEPIIRPIDTHILADAGPGCTISDPGEVAYTERDDWGHGGQPMPNEDEDAGGPPDMTLLRRHRDRIRRTRCDRTYYGWKLRERPTPAGRMMRR